MNVFTAAATSLLLMLMSCAQADSTATSQAPSGVENLRSVSPALERYRQDVLRSDLWERADLSPRDRSIVTVSALIARNQTVQLPHHINLALDNGVKPGEVSEIITHLAFYAGWSNAVSAVPAANQVFETREIDIDQLPSATGELLPLDKEAEARREARVDEMYGDVAPGVLKYTTEVLFRDLWLRSALSPRDRSLVTVSALIASGQAEQVSFHLEKAMVNGITKAEASEMLTHLAFYAGWPKVFSALPAAKEVFEQHVD